MKKKQIFISYSGRDAFEAGLLQFAIEILLGNKGASTWMFDRDKQLSNKAIARSIRDKVQQSVATVFLISPSTLESGATQWMELAYSDAFDVETYILLHHLSFDDLKTKGSSVPPLVLSSECNSAIKWKQIINDIEGLLEKGVANA